nr:small multi-drug export protein [bacterium]
MPAWLTDIWHELSVFGMALLPMIELRGSILLGSYYGLAWWLTFILSVAGSFLPAPFIIWLMRPILAWMRRRIGWLSRLADKLENRALKHKDTVMKYSYVALFLFVAIPLPGTGAWTGSLIAAVFNMRMRYALPAVLLGCLTAGLIMTLVGYGLLPFALPGFG